PYTDADRSVIARNRTRLFVGSTSTVIERLEPMITTSQADELMVITAVYDHEARKKSYRLLADAFGLAKREAA
ncbi:MAG: LLM class flavin-dependent oxidoreductase, partial [Bradyrhizobium sp.]